MINYSVVLKTIKILNKIRKIASNINVVTKVTANISSAKKALNTLKQNVIGLKNVNIVTGLSNSFNQVKNRLRGLAKSVKVKIIGEDKISPVVSKIFSCVKGLFGLAGTLKIGAGVVEAISMGSDLEQQKVSMKHFIGVNDKELRGEALDKKTDEYIKMVRDNAKESPFDMSEVIKAGSSALKIADGDTNKAMDFVKLAEDMAALNPGKSIEDAMEALADANHGGVDRLKDFGFDVNSDDFKAAGGDIFKMADSKGRTLQGTYQGGSNKMANTGSGMWTRIVNTAKIGVQDSGLKMLEALKPALAMIIPLMNQLGPLFDQIGSMAADAITFIITGLQQLQPYFMAIWQQLQPVFTQISAWATTNLPIIWGGFTQILAALEPVIATLIMLIGVFWQVFEAAWPILQQIGSMLMTIITAAIELVCGRIQALATVFQAMFDIAAPILEAIANLIKPIVEGIANIASGLGNKLAQWAGGGLSLMGGAGDNNNTNNMVNQNNNINVNSVEKAIEYTSGVSLLKYDQARGRFLYGKS